jgi:hypothetical protein
MCVRSWTDPSKILNDWKQFSLSNMSVCMTKTSMSLVKNHGGRGGEVWMRHTWLVLGSNKFGKNYCIIEFFFRMLFVHQMTKSICNLGPMKDLQIKQLIFLLFCLKLLSQMKPTQNWLRIRFFYWIRTWIENCRLTTCRKPRSSPQIK